MRILTGIFFALHLIVAAPGAVNAQAVHAILVADTKDASIGVGIKANLQNINDFLGVLAATGEIAVSKIEVIDDNFSCEKIAKAVAGLAIKPEDAVIFYYSGHGFRRNSTQTKFPEFDCRRTGDPTQIELDGVVKELSKKKPRFILAVADTCNKETAPDILPAAAIKKNLSANRGPALKRLFLKYHGTLMMSGSEPGEYSWYLVAGPNLGGFFTNQLLSAVDKEIAQSVTEVRWEDIAQEATKTILVPTSPDHTYQNPQFVSPNLAAENP